MVVLELETVYAQAAPHTKLLNKRFVGAHHWLGPLKEALVARLAADKVRTRSTARGLGPIRTLWPLRRSSDLPNYRNFRCRDRTSHGVP